MQRLTLEVISLLVFGWLPNAAIVFREGASKKSTRQWLPLDAMEFNRIRQTRRAPEASCVGTTKWSGISAGLRRGNNANAIYVFRVL